MESKSIAPLVIKLVNKAYSKCPYNTHRKSWNKILPVHLISSIGSYQVCNTIYEDKQKRSNYDVADFQCVGARFEV